MKAINTLFHENSIEMMRTKNKPMCHRICMSITLMFLLMFSFESTAQTMLIDETLSVQELVEDILIDSNCAEVSNFISSTGIDFITDGSGVNGIAAFSRGSLAGFPFDEGIILTSGRATSAPGPNDLNGENELNDGDSNFWLGDDDLISIIPGLDPFDVFNASSIQFDFVSSISELNFNFILASEEYNQHFECEFSDVFAFILTDQVTGVVQNLAVLPGTTTPIQVTNIHPEVATQNNGFFGPCDAVNEEFFAQYNYDIYSPVAVSSPSQVMNLPFVPGNMAPISYDGQTVPLTASGTVIPGNPYTIKLVIADFGDFNRDMAVFLEGGSFNLGGTDLGEDILLTSGLAVCEGESLIIGSDSDIPFNYEWFLDGNLIPGEDGPTLTVTEAGTYTLQASLVGGVCTEEDDIIIEFFPLPEVNLGGDQQLCEADSIVLDATPSNLAEVGNVTYQWFLDGNLIPGEDGSTLTVSQEGNYSVEATSVSGGCVVSDTINIGMGASFLVDLGGDVNNIVDLCGEVEYVINPIITGVDPAGVTYLWNTGETTPTITVTESGVFNVVVTYEGCTQSDEVVVSLGTLPQFDLGEDIIKCAEEEIILDATPTNVTDLSQFTFLWSNGATTPTISVVDEGLYTVDVTGANGCVETSEIDVRFYANQGCVISQGISPGVSLGFNDNLDLEFLNDRSNITELTIFSRLGNRVFEMNDYTNQWFGQDNDGNELPVGTYFYVIELESEDPITGWIYLNR